MLTSLAASDYVTLGQIISFLRHPRGARADDYKSEIGNLLDWLEACDFQTTKAAAQALQTAQIPHKDGVIIDSAARELAALVNPIHLALDHESKDRRVAVLNTAGVSQKLRGLPSRVTLNDTQRHLLDETIRCIECEAFRAGAVMGWNLTYDYIRRWVWDDPTRRAAFNAKLTAKTNRAGAPIYPAGLATYEDFYTIKPLLGERDVLELMKDAGLLTGVYEKLAGYLRDRNACAHASEVVPSLYQVNQYVEQLVDSITSPPFS